MLLDIRMPDQGGLELQKVLAEQNSHLPVIFLTGFADVPAAASAFKQGALDFIEKPAPTEVLLATASFRIETITALTTQTVRQAVTRTPDFLTTAAFQKK